MKKKLNNKLKILSNGKTSISFKYSLIERLKSINCPESVICDLIGMAKREFYTVMKLLLIQSQVGWIKLKCCKYLSVCNNLHLNVFFIDSNYFFEKN